jgi:hypothetical protein
MVAHAILRFTQAQIGDGKAEVDLELHEYRNRTRRIGCHIKRLPEVIDRLELVAKPLLLDRGSGQAGKAGLYRRQCGNLFWCGQGLQPSHEYVGRVGLIRNRPEEFHHFLVPGRLGLRIDTSSGLRLRSGAWRG